MELMSFIQKHPKEIGIGAAAMVAVGMYGFGRRKGTGSADEAEPVSVNSYEVPSGNPVENITFNIPGYANPSHPVTPATGTKKPASSTSEPPSANAMRKAGTFLHGSVASEMGKRFACSSGYGLAWESNNSGNVVCRNKTSGREIRVRNR